MKDILLLKTDSEQEIIDKAVQVVPSPRQIVWQELEFIAFIHFGVNTFTNKEWGDGTESPEIFNPINFDADQMVEAIKNAQMKAVVLTCKHHDGFCLWPSKYTEHSVKNSPWKGGKGDVVLEISEACKRHGIKFGVYLSPWDRHDERYGDSPAYNEYYLNQLTELLTEYGEVFDLWLDGACAEGPNGKKQEYDWRAIYAKVRELQPSATITGVAPDARWCGNEAGVCRSSEWSVMSIPNTEALPPETSDKTAYAFTRHNVGEKSRCSDEDLGSVERLKQYALNNERLYWYPAQVDLSIRPGWFYHDYEDEAVHSLEKLVNVYINSVGGNSQLLINLPPDKNGQFHKNDVKRLSELGSFIKNTFKENKIVKSAAINQNENEVLITCDGGEADLFMICEDISKGQRVESFELHACDENGWSVIYKGTTVGYKKLVKLNKQSYSQIKVVITKSRAVPVIKELGLFLMPPLSNEVRLARNDNGMVTLFAPNAVIYYTTDGTEPTKKSAVYNAPFEFMLGGVITAKAVYDGDFDGGVISSKEFGITQKQFKITNFSNNLIEEFDLNHIFTSDEFKYAKLPYGAVLPMIDIDMGQEYRLKGIHYMPVASGFDATHNINAFSLYSSEDGVDYEPVLLDYQLSNIYHNPILYKCEFAKKIKARYMRFEIKGTLTREKISIGEISFIKAFN